MKISGINSKIKENMVLRAELVSLIFSLVFKWDFEVNSTLK
jgi:hypothetical protein